MTLCACDFPGLVVSVTPKCTPISRTCKFTPPPCPSPYAQSPQILVSKSHVSLHEPPPATFEITHLPTATTPLPTWHARDIPPFHFFACDDDQLPLLPYYVLQLSYPLFPVISVLSCRHQICTSPPVFLFSSNIDMDFLSPPFPSSGPLILVSVRLILSLWLFVLCTTPSSECLLFGVPSAVLCWGFDDFRFRIQSCYP